MYFITTKRMLEVCFFQHTPTFIIEPFFFSRPSCGWGEIVTARVIHRLQSGVFYDGKSYGMMIYLTYMRIAEYL